MTLLQRILPASPLNSYLSQKSLNCRLAERDTFIITIIQNAMMEGRIQKTTFQGEATVESLDPDTVTKLLHYLDLTNLVTRSCPHGDFKYLE